MFAMFRLSSTP